MAVEQRERNYNHPPAVSFFSCRGDGAAKHSLRSSSSSCQGRRGGSVPSKLVASGGAPLSRMDALSQTCRPTLPSASASCISSRTRSSPSAGAIFSSGLAPFDSVPYHSHSSPDDDTLSSTISCSSATTLQSRPGASHSSENSQEDDDCSSACVPPGHDRGSSLPTRSPRQSNDPKESSSSGIDKDRTELSGRLADSQDGQDSQLASSFSALASPSANLVSNAADILLADWNESPFVSSYNNADVEAESSVAEDWSSRGSPWHIDINKVELGEMVASGSYGLVYKGLYKDEKVAVKMLLIPEASSTKETQKLKLSFRQEIDVWYTLSHPNIVQFIGACISPPKWAIVTEFLHGGSLRAYLQRQHRKKLSHKAILSMALDIARGMEYLHQNNIMHRDLKSANLLLDEDGTVKVADFGLARFETEDPGNLTAETGTIRWMAPEVICHLPYTRKIDVYSFGIVMWELCTSLLPFEGMSFVQLAHAVANDYHRPPTSDVPSIFAKLMIRCWDRDSTRRPEFSEVIRYLETGFSHNLETKFGSKGGSKSKSKSKSRQEACDGYDRYSRPTVSFRGGHVVGRPKHTPPLVINTDDEFSDQEEWLSVRRQCGCTIL